MLSSPRQMSPYLPTTCAPLQSPSAQSQLCIRPRQHHPRKASGPAAASASSRAVTQLGPSPSPASDRGPFSPASCRGPFSPASCRKPVVPLKSKHKPEREHSLNTSATRGSVARSRNQPGVAMAQSSGSGSPAGVVSLEDKDQIAVLFVCLGNICRSPTAEAVFAYLVDKKGLSAKFKIDSAGTIDYHEGGPADSRMRDHASRRGINLTSISRPIRPSDFEDFDLILAMDRQNLYDIQMAFQKWSSKHNLPRNGLEKVKLMCSFCTNSSYQEVPDPYYGGPQGFETVLDLLEDACDGLLNIITKEV